MRRRISRGLKRLGHIVISPKFQSDNAIDLLGLGGQHNDRVCDVSESALSNLTHFKPRHAWQHQIEHDQAGASVRAVSQALGAIMRDDRREAVCFPQLQGEEIDHVGFVFHNQDFLCGETVIGNGDRLCQRYGT